MEERLAGCHGNNLCRGFLVLRMPWKGMSSLHLRGDESASYLLPRARLLCPMWAVVPGEEMDRVEAAASHAGSHWGQEEASSPLAQTSALSRG